MLALAQAPAVAWNPGRCCGALEEAGQSHLQQWVASDSCQDAGRSCRKNPRVLHGCYRFLGLELAEPASVVVVCRKHGYPRLNDALPLSEAARRGADHHEGVMAPSWHAAKEEAVASTLAHVRIYASPREVQHVVADRPAGKMLARLSEHAGQIDGVHNAEVDRERYSMGPLRPQNHGWAGRQENQSTPSVQHMHRWRFV